MFDRVRLAIRASPRRAPYFQIGIGLVAALIAVVVRSALPLNPQQLPTITVVIAMSLVTPLFGIRAGITCAVSGGLASWYLFFNPRSWSLADGAWIPLIGFTIIAAVIIGTSHLYRVSERQHHRSELRELARQARNAQIFAGEMSHRLKNALAIVQAIALQTMDPSAPATAKFTGRLKALADANDLLSEHVSKPVANIADVIEASIRPFRDREARFALTGPDAPIPAQQVVALALALHELSTNAVKYGSLSLPAGRVTIAVEDHADHLELTWKEHDGPAVKPPERTGFGTRLLYRSGTDTRIDYEADGLRCTLSVRKD